MADWIKNNSWALIIAAVGVISTYSILGFKVQALEEASKINAEAITALTVKYDQSNVQTQIAIVQIQKDIEYIKMQLSRIFPPVN